MKSFVAFICLVLLPAFCVFAQWTQYTTGNSNIHSEDIIQVITDENDIVWMLMTDDPIFDNQMRGLQKFDGTTWAWYDTSNTANFPVPQSNSKHAAEMVYHNGKIYIVNGNFNPGIAEFDIANETVMVHNSTTPRNSFGHILVDANGLLYVSQLNSIQTFDGSTWTEYQLANGSKLEDMEMDNNGNVWATTENDELQKFDGSTWTVEASLSFTPMNSYHNMGIDQNNNVWISNGSPTQQMGEIAVWDGSTFSTHDYNSTGQNLKVVEQMVPDNSGNIWMDGIALFSYDGSTWGRFDNTNTNNTIAKDRVIDIAIDDNNTKWIASYGLVKYTGGPGGITSVSEIKLDQVKVKVYPNPARGELNIAIDEKTGHISIFNALGQVVFNKAINNHAQAQQVPVKLMNPGIYTVTITNEDGKVRSEKLIIQ